MCSNSDQPVTIVSTPQSSVIVPDPPEIMEESGPSPGDRPIFPTWVIPPCSEMIHHSAPSPANSTRNTLRRRIRARLRRRNQDRAQLQTEVDRVLNLAVEDLHSAFADLRQDFIRRNIPSVGPLSPSSIPTGVSADTEPKETHDELHESAR